MKEKKGKAHKSVLEKQDKITMLEELFLMEVV